MARQRGRQFPAQVEQRTVQAVGLRALQRLLDRAGGHTVPPQMAVGQTHHEPGLDSRELVDRGSRTSNRRAVVQALSAARVPGSARASRTISWSSGRPGAAWGRSLRTRRNAAEPTCGQQGLGRGGCCPRSEQGWQAIGRTSRR